MDEGRLASTAHTEQPWRIHELTRDFELEDVWALPTPGGPGDFPRLVEALAATDPSRGPSRPARVLWAIRSAAGGLLGWDEPQTDAAMVRDRLPADLRDAPAPAIAALPFEPLYLIDDEFAAEVANRTVHGVLHLGWVRDGDAHRGQLAVLVKPNGRLGRLYMAAIRPFRHTVIYPPMLREVGRRWRERAV